MLASEGSHGPADKTEGSTVLSENFSQDRRVQVMINEVSMVARAVLSAVGPHGFTARAPDLAWRQASAFSASRCLAAGSPAMSLLAGELMKKQLKALPDDAERAVETMLSTVAKSGCLTSGASQWCSVTARYHGLAGTSATGFTSEDHFNFNLIASGAPSIEETRESESGC